MFKRLAFSYLLKGVGRYKSELPDYDEVVVRSLYDFATPSDDSIPSQGGAVVEFHRGGRRIRWIEFGCRVVGGGGSPIVHEV